MSEGKLTEESQGSKYVGPRDLVPAWVYGGSRGSKRRGVGWEHPLKRAFDAVVAGVGLIIASPLCLLFVLAIKMDDRGPILFAQERRGRNDARIRVYKFRTMVPNADSKFGPIQAREHDPRVTRVGRILRATSLDEIPQLLNIARGDMSWVGPRALSPDEIQVNDDDDGQLPDSAIPGFETRITLRPGLTGIAQVFAPRDAPRRVKYQCDAVYADAQSLWIDLRLILLSLWITVRARWEVREKKF